MKFLLIILSVVLFSTFNNNNSKASAQGTCTLCSLGIPRNSDLIVPFLVVEDRDDNLSCSEWNEYAINNLVAGQELCNIIQSQSDYCGCGDSQIQNICTLCPDRSTPTNLEDITPLFETSCDDLDTYLRFLSTEQCETERVQAMQLADAFCGCPGTKQDCYMCSSDQTNNIQYPDRNIPFYDPSVGLTTPQFSSCQEIADNAIFASSPDLCTQVQSYDSYCGCTSSNTQPINACSLCPNGGIPSESTREIPALGMTCDELDLYISFLTEDQCSRGAAYQYQLFDYFCGCPDAELHCPICVTDNSANMANPDRIVPFLGFDQWDEHNPSCLFLATIGAFFDLESAGCDLIQAQGDFCGCDGASIPNQGNGCDYCPNGEQPANFDKMTQFGDTCGELATYLTYLPPDECDSTRVELIKQTAFSCGCPSAEATCPFCDDGTYDAEFPGRHIPLSISSDGDLGTCQDVIDLLIFPFDHINDVTCEDLKNDYSGYCGCPGSQPVNACSFCPGGEQPANGDYVVSESFTCKELAEFVSYMDKDRCSDDEALDALRAYAFACGCPGTGPACTLCPDGTDPLNGDDVASDDGRTCFDYARQVETFTEDICNGFELEITTIAAGPCDCGGDGVDFPRCPIQENAQLCTQELLDTVPADEQDCACYAFCDGEFVGCQPPQGGILREDECPGERISGCNKAGAEEAAETGNGQGESGAAVTQTSWNAPILLPSSMIAMVLLYVV